MTPPWRIEGTVPSYDPMGAHAKYQRADSLDREVLKAQVANAFQTLLLRQIHPRWKTRGSDDASRREVSSLEGVLKLGLKGGQTLCPLRHPLMPQSFSVTRWEPAAVVMDYLPLGKALYAVYPDFIVHVCNDICNQFWDSVGR